MTGSEKTPLWRSIAQALGADISAGLYGAGQKLPTEAALALRFGVNRHTVRAAIAHLAAQNIVHARRGAGVFVTQAVADYPLGPRVRFHQNVAATGRLPSRQITRAETLPCSAAEALALGLQAGAAVHIIEGVSLADAQPLALFRSVFPARLTGLLAALQAHPSVTVALAVCGVPDYTRLETRITAHLADGLQALALHIPQGAPLLRTVAINVDSGGEAIEYGQTWFAADRVALVLAGQDDLSQIRRISALPADQKG
jgi:GntR family transcriptional regulator, phosphonate transport system regulatory protein